MNSHKKILIVDDEVINLEFFEVMLTKLGFIVEKAADGVEALDKVRRFYPDLIILDNIMPRMSGWECTKTLKADPQFQEIPIIMLSALDDVKDKVESFELGVDDYITKPFNFSEVLVRIRAVLRNRELFAHIRIRESSLNLAEELSAEIKANLTDFIRTINALDDAIAQIAPWGLALSSQQKGEHPEIPEQDFSRLLQLVRDKSQGVRKQIAELDARIEKTLLGWEDIKKSNPGFMAQENQSRSSMYQ
ncbi:MAG: response regulator [Treponema sp.]|jgi:DNA-binding response OmpR family regulator|nr:response regulator [Treponema sp.]